MFSGVCFVSCVCLHTQIREEELFLKAVSLCHTVQISYDLDQADGFGDTFSHTNGFSQMEYYASSPDEKALVEATKRCKLDLRALSSILETVGVQLISVHIAQH